MLEERLAQLEQKLVSTGADLPPPIHSPSSSHVLEESTTAPSTKPKVDKEGSTHILRQRENRVINLFS